MAGQINTNCDNNNKYFVEICALENMEQIMLYQQINQVSFNDYKISLIFCCRENKPEIFFNLFDNLLNKYSHKYINNVDNDFIEFMEELFLYICDYGHIDILEYALPTLCKYISQNHINTGLEKCADNNNYKCYSLLVDRTDIRINKNGIFEKLAKKGHANFAMKLADYFAENEFDEFILNDIYIECTKHNRYEFLKRLIDYFGSHSVIFDYKYGMILAWPCDNCNVEIFDYFLTRYNEQIPVNILDNIKKIVESNCDHKMRSLLDTYYTFDWLFV